MTITCSGLWEFVVADSNELIFKTKNFLDFFVPFLESVSNFKHFEKEDDGLLDHSLKNTVSETPSTINILKADPGCDVVATSLLGLI